MWFESVDTFTSMNPNIKTHRRNFLKAAGLVVGTAGLIGPKAFAQNSKPQRFFTGNSKMKVGIVTYNIAKDWDVPTIIKNCTEAKIQGVELRTSHAHGVEVKLSKDQ